MTNKNGTTDSRTIQALAALAGQTRKPSGEDAFKFTPRPGQVVIGDDAPDVLEDAPTDHGPKKPPAAEPKLSGSSAQLIEIVHIVHGQRVVGSLPSAQTPTVVQSRPSAAPPSGRRIFTRDEINAVLMSRDDAVERGILTLFRLQTQDEQASAETRHHNGRGFNSATATVGTRFARWLLGMDDNNKVRYPPKGLGHPRASKIFRDYIKTSGSVIARAREICLLHSQQLTDVANGILVVNEPKDG